MPITILVSEGVKADERRQPGIGAARLGEYEEAEQMNRRALKGRGRWLGMLDRLQ
jgi:hypothetical protein